VCFGAIGHRQQQSPRVLPRARKAAVDGPGLSPPESLSNWDAGVTDLKVLRILREMRRERQFQKPHASHQPLVAL
jgi:hypothetical protein